MKARAMLPEENNLHVPPALLAKIQEAADAEHLTPGEFVLKAIQDRLDARKFDEVLAYGKRRAKERGLTHEDVATEIAKHRQETHSSRER